MVAVTRAFLAGIPAMNFQSFNNEALARGVQGNIRPAASSYRLRETSSTYLTAVRFACFGRRLAGTPAWSAGVEHFGAGVSAASWGSPEHAGAMAPAASRAANATNRRARSAEEESALC